ncbi:MarR family winged helix-turn-helix transcriptional regulator [Pseudofrankia inefficax]|uniref:MarR family winged helix-turn-helix transcriptional regulator n=1 Tax=Pseudofrankia inefficax (strain DSM 45817 / CECT 9037 / DDB 130130 / EuI1c) TaxID=298654 RepID=UPI001E478565|nr:MarR family winged helix-turn-helix transcriptional regulator [Pseudofrankia inefficax]
MPGSDALLPAVLRNRPSFVLLRLAALSRQHCADQLSSVGISQHQHGILCCLQEYGPACQRDIAARLSIDSGDLVAFVDGLQKDELITRQRDERDRRRQILSLTPAGARMLRHIEDLLDASEPGPLEVLPEDQRQEFLAAATLVLAHHAPDTWGEPADRSGVPVPAR